MTYIVKDREQWMTNDSGQWMSNDNVNGQWMPDTPVYKYISFIINKRDKYFEVFSRTVVFKVMKRSKYFEIFRRATRFIVDKRNKYFSTKTRNI